MKMKYKSKKIGLCLFLIFVLFLSPLRIFAEDEITDEEEEVPLENTNECIIEKEKIPFYAEKYGVNIDYDGDDTKLNITLKVPSETKEELKKISKKEKDVIFEIDYITVTDVESGIQTTYADQDTLNQSFITSSNKTLTYKNPLQIDIGSYKNMTDFDIFLKPVGFNDPKLTNACGSNSYFTLQLTAEIGGEAVIDEVNFPPIEVAPMTTGKIDCSKATNPSSFEYIFCQDREIAKTSGQSITFTETEDTYAKFAAAHPDKYGSSLSLKCDYDLSRINQTEAQLKEKEKTDPTADSYYVNKQYYYGKIVKTITGGDYVYNYECGVKREASSCKVSCEEVVTVEYGAPVASKAGFCFEYNVKVTSRVNCEMEETPKLPRASAKTCTPVPACVHTNAGGWIGYAAGPGEDFDLCINQCDGGKYSEKCSSKCYKQVYGAVNSLITSSSSSFIDFSEIVEKVYANNTTTRYKDYDYKGKYTCKDGKHIKWEPEDPKHPGLARFYKNKNYSHGCVKGPAEGGGIASVCGCGAVCSWTKCKGDVYLNPGEAEVDYEANIKVYEDTQRQCENYVKCNTTKSEFQMSVDYEYGEKNQEKESVEINLPFSKNNKDKSSTIQYIREDQNQSAHCESPEESNSLIKSSAGCYNCNLNSLDSQNSSQFKGNLYQVEFHFPGSNINSKTGDISYNKETAASWVALDDKFCLPLDTHNVNTKWWNYYYNQEAIGSGMAVNDTEYIQKINGCENYKKDTNKYIFSATDANDLNYNIHANAKKFGLFEWNFDINCFYAIYEKSTDIKNETEEKTNCPAIDDAEEVKMRIRTVDLVNLFPDSEGHNLSSPTTTGRSPGFNWSVHANNLRKDFSYTSEPYTYAKWVQTMGESIYSDEYLDYKVVLKRSDIQKIRSKYSQYTNFEGESHLNSVNNYRSPLFTKGSDVYLSESTYPSLNSLKCNNIGTHTNVDEYDAKCQTDFNVRGNN